MPRPRGVSWSLNDPRFIRVQRIYSKKRPEKDYDEARAILRELVRESKREGSPRRGRRARPSVPNKERHTSCSTD